MNFIQKYTRLCLPAMLCGTMLTSCGEDRSGEYAALTQEDRWIEQQMQDIYLWKEDMPTVSESDYFADPEEFFQDLLSTRCRNGEGDSFSYFESTESETNTASGNLYINAASSYGFDFAMYNDPTGTTVHRMARVLYVLSDSPAAEAGLKRGDWVTKVGGANITESNYSRLIQGGATTLDIAPITYTTEGEETVLEWGETTTLNIGAARQVSDDPFYQTAIYADQTGRKVGYLMYDHYSPGPDDAGTTYSDEMKQVFARFKSEGITELILDLRYNLGGIMTCITELCSYIAPSSSLGQPLFSLQYNDLNTDRNSTSNLDTGLAAQNLNLNTLYVITGPYTASASETTIYCLKPYMDVKVIGATTVGKNVASIGIVSPYDFTLHPIVATVYNSLGESDFESGLQPDYFYNELTNVAPLGEIGDPDNEALLAYTLQWIANGALDLPTTETETAASRNGTQTLTPGFTTLNHKRLQGNRIAEQ